MSLSLADSSDVGGGRARKAALSQWERDLNILEQSLHAYMDSSSRLIKQCPLNHYDPLNADAIDSEESTSIPQAFDHVSKRLPALALLEEQVRMSRVVLTNRRNRMTRISYVSRLPVELLQEIFRIVVAEYVHPIGDEIPSYTPLVPQLKKKRDMALTFTWVCQLWRDVALNTPDLWSRICFQDEPPFHVSKRWITRSQEQPLHISISPRWSFTNPLFNTNSFITAAMGTLTPYIRQWGCLDMTADHVSILHQAWLCMVPKDAHDFPYLSKFRSLRLSVNYPSESLSNAVPFAAEGFFKAVARNLTTICLRGVTLPWEADLMKGLVHLSLLFPNVTASTARLCPTTTDLSRIIQTSMYLQSLELGYFEIRYPPIPGPVNEGRRRTESSYQRVELGFLTTLRLRKLDSASLGFITHLISAPALESLLIEDYGPHTSQDLQTSYEETILSFVDRYSHSPDSKLTSLYWISKAKSLSSTRCLLKEVLGRLPRVTSLGLQNMLEIPPDLIRALALAPVALGESSDSIWHTPFLTSLSTLRLIMCNITMGEVVEILDGRQQAAADDRYRHRPPSLISLLHWRFNLDTVSLTSEDKDTLRAKVDNLQLEVAHVVRESNGTEVQL
ncbi:hypothetical protein FRC03_006172 [Tulasnella sp. 419]|nr:hypothetical protein FRC02_007681 [Tulasnella sp. 418]KAG8960735.1 hypothetical protein FRC03_006172 [Tulasnella sp. 419]